MKLLDKEIKILPMDVECAAHIMDAVPLVMRTIRTEMRSRRSADLSVPQFRALVFLYRQPGSSLSDVAEHIGLTLPSISKMIDRLVARKLVRREPSRNDRRCITLTLTALGRSTLQFARQGTQMRVAAMLTLLSGAERRLIIRAMQTLHPIFSQSRKAEARAEG